MIAALLSVLWFPGLVQWGIEHLPLPGQARLEGVVLRISRSAAAYRDKKPLVLLVLFLSFMVHFTTAIMYYFTALAISAPGVQFWPVVLGTSIQILATELSPVTIAGEGVRELAQLLLLKEHDRARGRHRVGSPDPLDDKLITQLTTKRDELESLYLSSLKLFPNQFINRDGTYSIEEELGQLNATDGRKVSIQIQTPSRTGGQIMTTR